MSKQVYFVVYYDSELDDVFLDEDTLVARFPEGTVWDTETNEWEESLPISLLAKATDKVKAGL